MHTNRNGKDLVRGYRSALYLGIGFAVASLALSLFFVRMKKDERDGWDEKDIVLEAVSGASTLSGGVKAEVGIVV